MPGYYPKHVAGAGSPVQRTFKGRFTGINAADPTSYKLDPGLTLVRTAEGTWKLTLPAPVAGFKSVVANVNDTGEYHELSWTLSVANRTVIFLHKTCSYASIASGPAAEDVVDEINFEITVEMSDTIGAGI